MTYKTNTRNTTEKTKQSASKSSVSRNTTSRKQVKQPIRNRSTYKTTTYKSSNRNNSKRRISSSKKYIERPIPKKTQSPKINKNVSPAIKPKQMDYTIFFVVLMLVMLGIVMVFSSSYYSAMTTLAGSTGGDKFFFLKKQATWAIIGLFAMLFMTFFDYKKVKKFSVLAYLGANVLLILVLVLGAVTKGAQRWIMGFQPSEFSKLAIILFMSYVIDRNPKLVTNLKGFIKCMILIGIPTLLVAKENLSTGIVIASIGCVIIFVAGGKILYFICMAIPVGIIGVVALIFAAEYRMDRITAWLDPFSDPLGVGYQILQSLYAIASGGLFGKGLGNSVQKLGFIPESHNDIIFSIVCEELGLVGAGGLILLFIIFISRGISTALRARDLFATLVATGITSMVAVQAIINIAVVTNTIPTTGMALPFISYGGSSLLMLMISMGILLNISCYTK